VTASDLAQARADWRQVTLSVAEMTAAVFLVLLCGPLLDWRNAIGDQGSSRSVPMRGCGSMRWAS